MRVSMELNLSLSLFYDFLLNWKPNKMLFRCISDNSFDHCIIERWFVWAEHGAKLKNQINSNGHWCSAENHVQYSVPFSFAEEKVVSCYFIPFIWLLIQFSNMTQRTYAFGCAHSVVILVASFWTLIEEKRSSFAIVLIFKLEWPVDLINAKIQHQHFL